MPLLSVEDVFQSRELWELPEEASVSRPPHDAGWRLGKKVALVAVVLTAAALCISVLGLQADGATSRGRDSDRVAIASAEPRTVKLAAAPNDLLLPGRPCYFAWQEKVDGGARQAMCFCQLAGNEGCRKKACACPQGCSGHTIVHPNSVTFRNFAQAQQCASTTALLTIPKSYFRDVNYLRSWCPAGAVSLLAEMIREGFAAYQVQGAPGIVRQCVHSGMHVSVPWLHLHTVCKTGVVDNMFHTGASAFCYDMSGVDEAEGFAQRIVSWASGGPAPPPPPAMVAPKTCQHLGCGRRGPAGHCSCSWDCRDSNNCCEDFLGICEGTCKAIGCGNIYQGTLCSCTEGCWDDGSDKPCCGDYRAVCAAREHFEHGRPQQHVVRAAQSSVSTCEEIGCGRYDPKFRCACNHECRTHGNCCVDYNSACVHKDNAPGLGHAAHHEPAQREPQSKAHNASSYHRPHHDGKHGKAHNASSYHRSHHDGKAQVSGHRPHHDGKEPRKTCKEVGCGLFFPGESCACNSACTKHGNCCEDYLDVCNGADHKTPPAWAPKSCKVLGCGEKGVLGSCSCNAECVDYHDCCKDYHEECKPEHETHKGSKQL